VIALLALLVVGLAVPASGQTDAGAAVDPAAAFRVASRMAADGDAAGAAAAFEAVAAGAPGSSWADDGLLEAARLREEVLGDVRGALALYERILSEYPDERTARRAQVRAEALRRGIGADGAHAETMAAYLAVLRLPRGEALAATARMAALLEGDPGFPRAGEARIWIAGVYERDGRFTEALAWFRRARAGASGEVAWQAAKGEADVLLVLGDLDGAEAGYRALLAGGGPAAHDQDARLETSDPARAAAVRNALIDVEVARSRHHRAQLAWIAVAGFVLLSLVTIRRATRSWPAAGRALLQPPSEVLYLAPVAGLIAITAATSNDLVARAIYFILGGGVAAAWLSGTALQTLRARRGRLGAVRVAVHVLAIGAAIAALCYLAVERGALLDRLAETVAHGPDGT
jgi:tetratricopeptide (TPR) repeat protein